MADWFRSWHGAPTDPKWLAVAKRAKVSPGVVSAIAWALMDNASQAEQRGSTQKFSVETYSSYSNFRATMIERVLAAMRDIGIIVDGRLSAWERRQPKREDGSAERAQQWRERNRTQPNATERHRVDTDTDIKKEAIEKLNRVGGALRARGAARVDFTDPVNRYSYACRKITESLSKRMSPVEAQTLVLAADDGDAKALAVCRAEARKQRLTYAKPSVSLKAVKP